MPLHSLTLISGRYVRGSLTLSLRTQSQAKPVPSLAVAGFAASPSAHALSRHPGLDPGSPVSLSTPSFPFQNPPIPADNSDMKKSFISIFTVFLLTNLTFAKITFGQFDLNKNDELLFTVTNETTGIDTYSTLFRCKIKDGQSQATPQMVSFYPEQMELLENGKILQVRNIYGQAKYNIVTSHFNCENTVDQIPEHPLPLVPYSVNFDGTWYCYLEQTSFITANLILKDATSDYSFVLSKNVQMSYENIPVKWSGEKNLLLYEKGGTIYFVNPDALKKGVEIDEKYRKIGQGTINSVDFSSSQFIAYINDSLLYKINTKELYTIGLYSGILGQGTVVGRLPFKFNPQVDKFSTNKNVNSVLIIQNKRMFTYLSSHQNSSDYMDIIYSRPYTDSSASLIDSLIFWDRAENPIIWLKKLPYDSDKIRASVYRISSAAIQVLEIEDSGTPYLSPDGNKVAFYAGAALYVYNVNNWSRMCELSGEKIASVVWSDSWNLYVGGDKSIRRWNVATDTSDVIALSSVTSAYWSLDANTIIADNNSGNNYESLNEYNTWRKLGLSAKRENNTQNGRYRAFLGTSTNYNYQNALFIRTLGKNPETKALYKDTAKKKTNRKTVALVFDAYDNADGLAQILSTMKKYKVKGDFFVNGEFIRRYPSETKQIVTNGFNCNSMFFSLSDLTADTFVIDEDFVRRGLARNEDEFYDCTGQELLLYWHAPYYKTNEKITQYGQNAGYTYIDQKTENLETGGKNPFTLIQEYYTQAIKNKGGIIPITVGYSQAKETDYLYNYLDLLICALIQGGFELVSLNEM